MSHKCQSILHAANGRLLGEMASVSADFANRHMIPEHSHPEDQLLFASSGVMTLRTKQGVWVVPPLRAVWIPANTPHSVAMSGPVSMRTLYFLPRLCRGSYGGATDYRIHRGAVEGCGFYPATVAASDGRARDASGESAAG